MSQRSRPIYAGRTAVQPADSMDVFGRLSFGTLRDRVSGHYELVAFITDTSGAKQRDRCVRSRESGSADEF
jgi:hypothetical protein